MQPDGCDLPNGWGEVRTDSTERTLGGASIGRALVSLYTIYFVCLNVRPDSTERILGGASIDVAD